MDERKMIVEYLRHIANTPPPPQIHARNPQWTPDVLRLTTALLLTCAEQIEQGLHYVLIEEAAREGK